MQSVTVNGQMGEFEVSGIYQCANGTGTNIGMSIGGNARIDDITGYIWCRHYILEGGSVRDYVYDYLEEHYRGIDVHTNSWSRRTGSSVRSSANHLPGLLLICHQRIYLHP